MADRYIDLSLEAQHEIIMEVSSRIGRTPTVVEKDIWVCWALNALFTMPGRVAMAFKGGTSLSKVYGAIHRFSEDVDVTLDYRALAPDAAPLEPGLSKTKLKKLALELKERVKRHTMGTVVPHLTSLLRDDVRTPGMSISHDDEGEKVWIRYQSAVELRAPYVPDSVLVELGGCNITEPNEEHDLEPFAAAELPKVVWPKATINVLSPHRTFWEKATLIHAECNRGELRASPERLSRHWYDLAMLAQHSIGEGALAKRELLTSVVAHKEVFFHASHAHYRDCLGGKLKLVPTGRMLAELRVDFAAMVEAGMFNQEPPSFDEILKRLASLSDRINDGRASQPTSHR